MAKEMKLKESILAEFKKRRKELLTELKSVEASILKCGGKIRGKNEDGGKVVPVRRGPRNKVDDDKILKFLKSEHTNGQLIEKFGFSPVTAAKRLQALKSAGKLGMRKDGRKKLWKVS